MKIILFLFFATYSISAFSQIEQNVNKTAGTKGGKVIVHYDDLFVY